MPASEPVSSALLFYSTTECGMQNSSAKATIIGWLDLSIPDQQLHFDLVQALYRTPKSILGATVASLVVIAMAWAMSGDFGY